MERSIRASATADRPQGPLRRGAVGIGLTGSVILVGLLAPWIAPHDPFALVGPALSPPSVAHPLGTDALGRDVLSGVVFGARTSLLVGLGVGVLTLVAAVGVGSASGYAGTRTDHALMRVTEFFQVVPRFFLALLVIALFGPGLDRLVLVLGLTSWPVLARVVRAEVLTLREAEFVLAARAGGATGSGILLREILPNALPPALVLLGLVVGQVLLVEAGLGFLGLGDPERLSWGYQVAQAQPFLRVAWWTSIFPGGAIVMAVLGLNLLGDALGGVGGSRP